MREEPVRANDKAERQNVFLEAYASVGNIGETAKQTGINRCTHYAWMDEADSEYSKRFHQAEEDFRDLVRESVRTRAILGISQDVYDAKGNYVGTRTTYSDRLLERLAEAKCPEFKRKTEVTSTISGTVSVEVKELAEVLSTEELLVIRERLRFRSTDQSGPGGASTPPPAP